MRALTLVVAGALAAWAAPSAAQVSVSFAGAASSGGAAMEVVDATLLVNGSPAFGPFTARRDRPGYLFFYLPGRGLYTIGTAPFEGAREAGAFRGRTMELEVAGTRLELRSATPMLREPHRGAWVRHQPDYQLNVQGVLYGYGDDPSAASRWLEQFGAP